jgi:hypothetical protein
MVSDAMADELDDLLRDLLEWVGSSPRPYAEVIDAWRTSCPRLPVWEEANTRGFVERQHVPNQGQFVAVSMAGLQYMRQRPGL